MFRTDGVSQVRMIKAILTSEFRVFLLVLEKLFIFLNVTGRKTNDPNL